MNLDELTIEIRPRWPWEAVDLGMLMARRWWRSLMKIWLVVTLPFWCLLYLIPSDFIVFQVLIFWWLAPIFERLLLHFLSNAVFNQVLTTKEVTSNFFRLAKPQFFVSLLWRRFSFTRSMDMPVMMLEGLAGSARTSRLSILHREDAGPAGWISVFSFLNVIFIAFTLFVFGAQFIPSPENIPFWEYLNWGESGLSAYWYIVLVNALLYFSYSLVVPFYVAGGFALYLNRRIRLEAWDIEIAFRRIVQKRAEKSNSGIAKKSGTIVVSLIISMVLLFSVEAGKQVVAEELSVNQTEHEELNTYTKVDRAKENIDSIMKGDHFNQKKTESVAKYPWDDEEDKEDEDEEYSDVWSNILDVMARVFSAIANVGEVLIWVLVLGLILFVLLRYRHWLVEIAGGSKSVKRTAAPTRMFGLEVTKESLPDNVGDEAQALWQSKKHREALALLYRACLAQLILRGLEIEDGDTEQECLNTTFLLGSKLGFKSDTLQYFKVLTRHWRQLAYGHFLPTDSDVTVLCQTWGSAWEPKETVND